MPSSPWRDDFPIGRERQTLYLNSAGEGPYCRAVDTRLCRYLEEKRQPHRRAAASVFGTSEAIRQCAARLLKGEPEGFAFIHSTGEGMNILAQGLDWQAGDRVLLLEKEFPAGVYPFLNLAERGVAVDFCPCPDGIPDLDALAALLGPRTRLLACSWVQFHNGYTQDLTRLRELTRHHDCLLALDASQGAGLIPLDLKQAGVDALVLSAHKSLCAPTGSGLLYLAPAVAERFSVRFAGWLHQVREGDFNRLTDYRWRPPRGAERFEIGSDSQLLQGWLLAMLEWFEAQGVARLHAHVRALVERLAEGIAARGLRLAVPREHRSVICAFGAESAPRTELIFARLAEAGVIASLREGWIRLSLHAYNEAREVEAFLALLDLALFEPEPTEDQ